MKARPILFNGAMVRAICAGHKTVTRRAMRVQPVLSGRLWEVYGAGWSESVQCVPAVPGHSLATQCPYGQVGDRLWVRETFMDLRGTGVEHRPDPHGPLQRYAYAAECPPGSYADEARKDMGLKWRPSIHMPRAASRLELEIVAVRVERLQAISRADIRAEGLVCPPELAGDDVSPNYRDWYPAAFRALWESTGGDWVGNPWVWVVEFRRVLPEAMAAGVAA
ncbi:hypothetical protein D3C81_726350 [compost metagenome]